MEGFFFFMGANIMGAVLFCKTKMWYMFTTQIVFGITSMNGIYQNFFKIIT